MTERCATEWDLTFMFPAEVAAARKKNGLIILSFAPIEWHGPHMAMGCDALLAGAFARRLAAELECPYYPTLAVGTERERDPQTLKSIGFRSDEFIEGMDFPDNAVKSGYHREEVFAVVVRDTLNILFDRMRFRRVLMVNGHGAGNQRAVVERLCAEFNAGVKKGKRVMWVYPGFSRYALDGSIAHAGADETSLLAASHPECVDLSRLPQRGRLKNVDFAIVDGPTFDGKPTRGHTVRERQDPRKHMDVARGEEVLSEAVREVVLQARKTLLLART